MITAKSTVHKTAQSNRHPAKCQDNQQPSVLSVATELHHENRIYIDGCFDVPVFHQRRIQGHELADILVK